MLIFDQLFSENILRNNVKTTVGDKFNSSSHLPVFKIR